MVVVMLLMAEVVRIWGYCLEKESSRGTNGGEDVVRLID